MIAIGAPPRSQGIQKGRGGFLRSADDKPYVTDPRGRMTNHDGNKPDLIALCRARGIDVPEKITVAQLHELLGKRPCRVPYGSPSGAGKDIESQAGLIKHKQRYIFQGIGLSEEVREACKALALMDPESDDFDSAADAIAVKAVSHTDYWLAADRGSHGHLLCERWDRKQDLYPQDVVTAGEVLGLDYGTQVGVCAAWANLLADNGLEILAIEAACVDDKWRLAGTLDRIVRCTRALRFVMPGGEVVEIPAGTVLVLDIKFGAARRAHLIQIASYAQSVPYDTETETRGEWPW